MTSFMALLYDVPAFSHSAQSKRDIHCLPVVINVTTTGLKLDDNASLQETWRTSRRPRSHWRREWTTEWRSTSRWGSSLRVRVRNAAFAGGGEPTLTTNVPICRSTGKSCRAWNTFRTCSGKMSEVSRRLYFIFPFQLKCDETPFKGSQQLIVPLTSLSTDLNTQTDFYHVNVGDLPKTKRVNY